MLTAAGESILNWLWYSRLAEMQKILPSEDACPRDLKRKRVGAMAFCLFLPSGLVQNGRFDPEVLSRIPLAMLEGDGRYTRK